MSIAKSRYNDYYDSIGGFHRVPNDIWEVKIDHTCKVIWCYLLSRPLNWDSSRNNIARNLEMSVNTVSACIAKLEANQMLIKTSRNGQNWDFEILPPSEWAPVETEPTQLQIQIKNDPDLLLGQPTQKQCSAHPKVDSHSRRKKKDEGEPGTQSAGLQTKPTPVPQQTKETPSSQNRESGDPIRSANTDNRASSIEYTSVATGPLQSGPRPSIQTVVKGYSGSLSQSGRYEEMLQCAHELKSYGYKRPDVLAAYNTLLARWTPSKKKQSERPKDKVASWLSCIREDLTLALNDAFPAETPVVRSKDEVVEDSWLENITKLGKLARIERK